MGGAGLPTSALRTSTTVAGGRVASTAISPAATTSAATATHRAVCRPRHGRAGPPA